MADVVAHALAQVEPAAVGVHLLWTGPWQWVWSLDGWSIQRRELTRDKYELTCVRLDDGELVELRRTHRKPTVLGLVTFRTGLWPQDLRAAASTSACEVFTLHLSEPARDIRVAVTSGRFLAIAMRGNQAVAHVEGAGSAVGTMTADGVTDVFVYAIKVSAVEWCVQASDPKAEEASWRDVPFIVKHLQLPLADLVPALGAPGAELAEGTSRLLAGETLDPDEFARITDTLRASVSQVGPPRPADQVALLRAAPGDEPDETMAVDPMRVLLVHPTWRRVLGFGWFDDDPSLVPGRTYEYRVTGWFPAEDLADRVYGFHTVPSGTQLPACFWLDDLRVRLPQPVVVERDPTTPDSGAPVVVTRRGIAIEKQTEPWWLVPDMEGSSLVLDFAEPVTSVILEMAPGPSVEWTTGTSIGGISFTDSGSLTPGANVRIDSPAPFDHLQLFGMGFLFAVRVPAGPSGVEPRSVVVSPVVLADAPRPDAPLLASLGNLQHETGVPAQGDPPAQRHDLGFEVRWRPAPSSGLTSWPADAPAPPPLDAAVYELEHRTVTYPATIPQPLTGVPRATPRVLATLGRVDPRLVDGLVDALAEGGTGGSAFAPLLGTFGPWEPVLDDGTGTGAGHWTLGDRDRTEHDHAVAPGSNVLDAFPEPGRRVVAPDLDVHWRDVFDFASPVGPTGRPVPAPGTHHQYRVRTIDAIGRPSLAWRETEVLRLEKHVPPPLPAGPAVPPVTPHARPEPTGVFARALVKDAPDLTPGDVSRLGADDDVVVLSWGWHQQERDQDPFAREFRVYLADNPLDRVAGTIAAVTPLGTGRHRLDLTLATPLDANELEGTFVHAGHPFRVLAHTAGSTITIDVEGNVPGPTGDLPVPTIGPVELTVRSSPRRRRPAAWTQRVATVPISAATTYEFELRNVLHLTATRPLAHVWVGVSAADDQFYVLDQRAPTDTRPGNESGVAVASVAARWQGRPVFDVPPPLAPVPVVRTPEPNGREVLATLDLIPFLAGTGLVAGARVLPERVAADTVFSSYRVTPDDRVIALPIAPRPGEAEQEVVLLNPADRAAVVASLNAPHTDELDGRFVVFLAGMHPYRDRLFAPAADGPLALGPFTDRLPPQPARWVYRFRAADEAGHLSAGGAMAACVVRVPSLAPPSAPDRLPAAAGDPPGGVRVRLVSGADVDAVLAFVEDLATAPPGAAEPAAVVRVPNRTDLAAGDVFRLRIGADGVLAPTVVPTTGPVAADGSRDVAVTVPGAAGDAKRLWLVALSADGLPSALSGPWTLRWPPVPVAAPVLSAAASTASVVLAWTWPSPATHLVAVERMVDGAWQRVSPLLAESATSWTSPRPVGALRYRLQVAAADGRTATSNEATP